MELRQLSSDIIRNSEQFADIIGICSSFLRKSDDAKEVREYLKDRIPNYSVDRFSFGYFPKNYELRKLFEFIDPFVLERLGLIYKRRVYDSGHEEMAYCSILSNHNLIMPYKNVYGDIVGLVGRSVLTSSEQKENKISKYKNTSLLKGLNLFGIYEAKQEIIEKGYVVLVEGQFDCITCHRYGFKNVVALGGSSFTKYHFFLIKRYTNRIYLLLDNDLAGNRETENIISRYSKDAEINKIILPTCYKDIDECLRKGGDNPLLKI